MKRLLIPSWLLFVAIGCEKPGEAKLGFEAIWPNAVSYEIFVQSFNDTDGDGIGDINGVTEKLDYLEELGIKGIWLMPIMPSPSYHKYDVTDYRDIHSDYGTLEEFRHLVSEAHKRDIRIIIDLVINHSSSQHPWFLQAKSSPQSQYRDYYVWGDYDSVKTALTKMETSPDSDNIYQWHDPKVENNDQRYFGFFSNQMPDLNFDHQPLRNEIYDIGRFWLKEIGVDGFRLDAARHIYPHERAADSHAFWVEFRERMESFKSDVLLVGEVWAESEEVAPFLQGLHSTFNFELRNRLIQAIKDEEASYLAVDHKAMIEEYSQFTEEFYDAIILSNHDQNRILSDLNGDIPQLKLAAAVLHSLPGTPYLYYGEEIGMLGVKPDPLIREPFLWDQKDEDHGRPTWEEAVYSTDEAVKSLGQQKKDTASVFNFYKRLLSTRNGSEALTLGDIEPLDKSVSQLLIFKRISQNQEVLVLHNVSSGPLIWDLPQELGDFSTVLFSNGQHSRYQNMLQMDPWSSIFFVK